MYGLRFLCLGFAALLAGCATGAAPSCPQIGMIPGISNITLFYPMQEEGVADIVSRAAFVDYKGDCKYSKGKLVVDLDLSILAELGRAGQKEPRQKMQQYPYFVAILDPQENILLRKSFVAQVPFDDASAASGTVESLRQTIPLSGSKKATEYKVLFGFQLTPEQLQYNRNRHQL